jgi:hypothetical protein
MNDIWVIDERKTLTERKVSGEELSTIKARIEQ